MGVCSVRAIPEEAPLTQQNHNSGNTAWVPQSQSSSIDWLNPFTWFYRGYGERNNEEMKGGCGSSIINLQSQRKILRRPRAIRDCSPGCKLSPESILNGIYCLCRCDCCECCPCSEELDYY